MNGDQLVPEFKATEGGEGWRDTSRDVVVTSLPVSVNIDRQTSMDPYTPRTRPAGRKKNLALSTKEYTKVCGSCMLRAVLDVHHHRLQERSHLRDGVVIWSMASMMNGTDAVDTISSPKVLVNVLVRHLLALMAIRSFIHRGDILRQSAAQLSSSITFVHHTQNSWERQITRGEPGQCVFGYPGGSDSGGFALCFDGEGLLVRISHAYNIPTGNRRDIYYIPPGLFC